jgi:hypothetical protein
MRGNSRLAAREEHPVGCPKRGPPHLAAQHRYLVSEDNNLGVLRQPQPQDQQLQDALERDVKNRQNHGTSDDTREGRYFMQIELTHPTRIRRPEKYRARTWCRGRAAASIRPR